MWSTNNLMNIKPARLKIPPWGSGSRNAEKVISGTGDGDIQNPTASLERCILELNAVLTIV